MRKDKKDKAQSEELDKSCETQELKDSFESRKKQFDKYYIQVVVFCLVMVLAAVAVAMYLKFIIGILIFIAVPVVYVVFVGDRLEKALGLSYKTLDEGVSVAVIKRGKKACDTEAYIPEKLFWYGVVAIHKGKAEKADENVTELHIPSSVKVISEDAFSGMSALSTIYFEGTESEWETVDCKADTSAIKIVCISAPCTENLSEEISE